MMSDDSHTSKIALGVVVICAFSIGETSIADHMRPNPASPIVWTVLGAVAILALGAHFWFKSRAKREPQR